jgi:hypothetical protein
MTGQASWNIPICKANFSSEVRKITVIVPRKIGINPAPAEPLEKVCLSQITNVVPDAGSLRPIAHCPKVAGDNRQAKDAAKYLQHTAISDRYSKTAHFRLFPQKAQGI